MVISFSPASTFKIRYTMFNQAEDQILLRKYQHGDNNAYQEIYKKYFRQLVITACLHLDTTDIFWCAKLVSARFKDWKKDIVLPTFNMSLEEYFHGSLVVHCLSIKPPPEKQVPVDPVDSITLAEFKRTDLGQKILATLKDKTSTQQNNILKQVIQEKQRQVLLSKKKDVLLKEIIKNQDKHLDNLFKDLSDTEE